MPKGKPIVKLPPWSSKRRTARIPSDIERTRDKAPDYVVPVVGQRVEHRGGKSGTYVEPTSIYAEPAFDKPCTTKRKCAVELAFLGKKHAASAGVQPGVYLRICAGMDKVAKLVPVKDHREAQKAARAFCACRRDNGTVDKCLPGGPSDRGPRPKSQRRS